MGRVHHLNVDPRGPWNHTFAPIHLKTFVGGLLILGRVHNLNVGCPIFAPVYHRHMVVGFFIWGGVKNLILEPKRPLGDPIIFFAPVYSRHMKVGFFDLMQSTEFNCWPQKPLEAKVIILHQKYEGGLLIWNRVQNPRVHNLNEEPQRPLGAPTTYIWR